MTRDLDFTDKMMIALKAVTQVVKEELEDLGENSDFVQIDMEEKSDFSKVIITIFPHGKDNVK